MRDRIWRGVGTIRNKGSDYLAYALLDTIVDSFFPVLETIGEDLEDLEDEVVERPTRATIEKIHRLRRGLMKATPLYLAPAQCHQQPHPRWWRTDQRRRAHFTSRTFTTTSSRWSISSKPTAKSPPASWMCTLSSISNRMNEVMKLLTVISTVFIPLTFIAGVYGMNFNPEVSPFNMPELNWYWGYVACLVVMFIIAAILIYFFWKQGWFEKFDGNSETKIVGEQGSKGVRE